VTLQERESPERDGRIADEPALATRGRLRAPLVAMSLLVVTGVLVAALLRPFFGVPPTRVDRAARNRPTVGEGVGSLDRLRREPRASRQDASSERPAHAAPVIGVGTGQFGGTGQSGGTRQSGGSESAAIVDPDGPPDPSEVHAPSDSEVRRELTALRSAIDGVDPRKGARAYIDSHGRAVLPKGSPRKVALVVAAANEIATKPYKWGGGHGAWKDSGYDCSGSVSFALAGGRLLDRPLDSSGLMRFGADGPGEWISIYANSGHVFMTVAGLRFDTSGANGGTRWQRDARPTAGYAARHPSGL
jgi:hypothetical protein